MTDSTLDDVYDDPDNILADDDKVDGSVELPEYEKVDPSQSIFVPEKDTTPLDDRGPIDELEAADASDIDELEEVDPEIDPGLLDDAPTGFDPDDYHPGDVNPADEQDGTES
jgi:hypothetical protein